MNKLYILCGIPFSGKTTLAKGLVQKFGFTRIDLDDIKFELFGIDIKDSDLEKQNWDSVYKKMYARINEALKEGKTVIHDTGNFTKHERDLVKDIADESGIEIITIFIDTPASVARERMLKNKTTKKRFDIEEKDFDSTVAEMEPPTSDENLLVFHYGEPFEAWIQKHF